MIAALAALAALAVSGCREPSFGSRLSEEQIDAIGSQAAVQIEAQYKLAPADTPGRAEFDAAAAAVTRHAVGLPAGARLRYALIDSAQELAISLPDGHVYISDGLLSEIAGHPNQIACLLAEEAGHVALQHDVNNLSAALGGSEITDMLSEGKYQDVVNTELELGRLSYTKEQEYQADRYAVRVAAASGYDATGLLRFLQFVTTEPKTQSQVYWTDTHTTSKVRAARVEQDLRNAAR